MAIVCELERAAIRGTPSIRLDLVWIKFRVRVGPRLGNPET